MTPVLELPAARRWRSWLARNHDTRRPQTRARRLETLAQVLAEGRKIHP